MKGRAVITGADGGMGTEITRAVAAAGYEVVMLCYDAGPGKACRDKIAQELGPANSRRTVARRHSDPPVDEQRRDDVYAFPANARRTGADGSSQLCGSLPVDPSVIALDERRDAGGLYGLLHVCHRKDNSGIFYAREKGQFLAHTDLQQHQTGFMAICP